MAPAPSEASASPSSPSSDELRRLALIRHLFGAGFEASRGRGPTAGLALLQLHDSAELLLQLSAEHVNAGEGSQGFLDYWERLSSRVTGGIPHKEKMRRLNKARVNLKHNGTLPAREDLLGFGDAVREFLNETTARVFGLDFDTVSLALFVPHEEVRLKLVEAEQLLRKDRLDEALQACDKAFSLLIQRTRSNPALRKLDKTGLLNSISGSYENEEVSALADDVSNSFDEVIDAIDEIREELVVMWLALDVASYRNFQVLRNLYVPVGRTETPRWSNIFDYTPLVRHQVEFAIGFVADSSFRIEDYAADGILPTVTSRERARRLLADEAPTS